ncbi:MAG TPA: exodeoxyribonuclease III [Acidimicrobiales bacterium]|nr:exodeoxyribonuclease III [Acidimicrobiales bacterium]
MRIATWNVNSLKARLGKVEEWLEIAKPDVLCMQETKMADAAFPALAFHGLGYESVHHGNGRWNGVAILSRVGLEDAHPGFSGEELSDIEECRFLSARCGGVRVASVYVPNGRSVGSEHYEAKLEWLERLRLDLAEHADPSDQIALCGDFNIAPEDRDVFDPAAFVGATHVSEPEREALRRIEEWGLEDGFRRVYPGADRLYSWWDYRAGDFHKHRGMRIDLLLLSAALADKVTYALIDREARKGMGSDKPPSDHAPVFVDVAIGPASA